MAEKFRKKPVVIEAMQWLGNNYGEMKLFLDDSMICWHYNHNTLSIQALEGAMIASVGDWVIRGEKGEFYLCKPDIFDATYESLVDGLGE